MKLQCKWQPDFTSYANQYEISIMAIFEHVLCSTSAGIFSKYKIKPILYFIRFLNNFGVFVKIYRKYNFKKTTFLRYYHPIQFMICEERHKRTCKYCRVHSCKACGIKIIQMHICAISAYETVGYAISLHTA